MPATGRRRPDDERDGSSKNDGRPAGSGALLARLGFGADGTGGAPGRRAVERWAFPLFVFFGAAQIAAALVFVFAYNWRDLPDLAKIALPQTVMIAGVALWALTPRHAVIGAAGNAIATVMIGVSMGVVGQVYQLGADPWRLFAIWAALALPIAGIARSNAQFALWFAIASTAYFLYADEVLRPRIDAPGSLIPAIYSGLALLILIAREAIGEAPRWQRWLIAAASLVVALGGGLGDVFKDAVLFGDGPVASVALFVIAGAYYILYGDWRRDRPTRSLALFAIAVWVGACGFRLIAETVDPEGAWSMFGLFIISAGWIVVVTIALAFLLRRLPAEAAP